MSGTIKAPVLILGATGVVGRGIVQAAVEAARPVIAVARDRSGLEQLKASYPDADISNLPGSVAGDGEAMQLAAELRRLRRPLAGIVVAVSGPGARGRVLDQPAATLCRQIDQDLLPHLAAARHLLPLLAERGRGGSYVLIGGPGSGLPWAGYGHRSIAASALRMLTNVLHDEAHVLGLRVQLLSVDVPVCIEGDRMRACPHWPTAASIGRRALELVERGNARRKTDAIVHYAKSDSAPERATVDSDAAGAASYVRDMVANVLKGTVAGARTTSRQHPGDAPDPGSRHPASDAAGPAPHTGRATR